MKIRSYIPHIIVFYTSMGVMIIEILASRIVAKHFGNSLYTWTSVIGIVLGGISLGNYIGGKLADKFKPRSIIPIQLIATSLLILLIIPLDAILYSSFQTSAASLTRGALAGSLVWVVMLFILPATAIGTISPVMAKFALEQKKAVGNTVGGIYAVSAVGSIAGTFLAGYFLIPLLGIRNILFIVGGLIAVLAFAIGGYRIISAAWIFAISLLFFLLPSRGFSTIYHELDGAEVLFETDSEYSHILVRDVVKSGEKERQLIMDGLLHNRYDVRNPDNLLYIYEKLFDSITRIVVANRDAASGPHSGLAYADFTTLTLGGGAVVYPNYLKRHYPGSRNTVVEIDPEVIRIAKRYFDLPEATGREHANGLEIVNVDARRYVVSALGKVRFNLVYLDVFDSYAIPSHLTTREFAEQMLSILAPGGLLVANCIDIFEIGGFVGAYLKTLRTVFQHVYVYMDAGSSFDRRATFVVAAGNEPFNHQVLLDKNEVQIGHRVSQADLEDLLSRSPADILTDDYAPVENLIAPVFLDNVK